MSHLVDIFFSINSTYSSFYYHRGLCYFWGSITVLNYYDFIKSNVRKLNVVVIYFYNQMNIKNILKQQIYLYLHNRKRLLETLLDQDQMSQSTNCF